MISNTKVLVVASLLIIILGFNLLWFGSNSIQETSPISSTKTTQVAENSKIATESGVVGASGEQVLVTKVIDGDTIQIEGNITIRLIGIDTPETKDPRRPVGCFGKEASNETKSLIDGKMVILEKDISDTDKYGRLLRYIYLPLDKDKMLFVNDYLVREGYALVLTYPPDVKYNDQLREAETQAKLEKRGLWGRC